jgi:transketolase
VTLRYIREKLGAPEPIMPGIQRGVVEAASKNPRIVAVMSDLGHPGYDWFFQHAPNRIIELGVAEANAATFCGGLASEGYIPVWHTFAFCIGRAYNQIRQCICVDRFNVKMLFHGAGYFPLLGISHNCIEDVAAMRALPNMVIVSPADVVEAEKAVRSVTDYVGPVYYRIEDRGPSPARIFKDDYEFELGKAVTVRDGHDASIISYGFMVTRSIHAASMLKEEGIDVKVVNMSTIKPLDEEAVLTMAEETGAIVTVENHSIIGGLGEAVAAVLVENNPIPMKRVGFNDEFSQSGIITSEGVDQLGVYYNLMPEDIVLAVKKVIAMKRS